MISASISIDVPDMHKGIEFFSAACGFSVIARPYPGVTVLRTGQTTICLLEKASGTTPSPSTTDRRDYRRHWTPVHLDFHVANLSEAIETAVAAGAVVEQRFANPEHGGAAFCSDPFGHGFCLIEQAH